MMIKDLRKHLVVEHNTLRKEWIEKRAYLHIYIRRYLGGIPIERECFCGRGNIPRHYKWPSIV